MAPPGESLYYVHSKTAYYNSFFFDFWHQCFVRTFRQVCPFYEIECVDDLDKLLNAKVQRYTLHYYLLARIITHYNFWFHCCRPDGSELLLVSSSLLHIFDQTMYMLPFATRTDLFDALKKADVRATDLNAFLDTLLAEHNVLAARPQLRTLWTGYLREVFQREGTPPPPSAEAVRARAQTPPDEDPEPPAADGAV